LTTFQDIIGKADSYKWGDRMIYISELAVEAFRGIVDLKLNNLGEINVIAGINNSGKTSILEAISLLENPLDVVNAVRVSRRRDILGSSFIGKKYFEYPDSFINMFNMNEDSHKIALSGMMNGHNVSLKFEGVIEKKLLSIDEIMKKISDPKIINVFTDKLEVIDGEIDFFSGRIEYRDDGDVYEEPVLFSRLDQLVSDRKKKEKIHIEYISPIDHVVWNERLDSVIKEGLKSEIVELLKIFDPQIKGFEVIRSVPYIEHEALHPMPLSTYGDGLRKIFLLAASVVRAKGGILLIDELETAIHFSALEKIFKWFVKSCKEYKVQVFATTHSLEVIDAMLENVKGHSDHPSPALEIDPFRIITLKKQDQKTLARILSGQEALSSREKFEMELR
jgi:AAA15 family ATPase/GTPase